MSLLILDDLTPILLLLLTVSASKKKLFRNQTHFDPQHKTHTHTPMHKGGADNSTKECNLTILLFITHTLHVMLSNGAINIAYHGKL